MNVLLSPQPPLFPHPHQHEGRRLSPPRSASPFQIMNRKRKADEDGDEMSISPTNSPALNNRQVARPAKKVRSNDVTGRPLALPRLLETLDASQLRAVLQTISEQHPAIGQEIVSSAPRPTSTSALQVLHEYQERLQAAMPYGESSSEYIYCRIRQPLVALVDALSDFTPQYLPPIEMQATVSLQYLDGATKVIHALPEWTSQAHRHHKDNAYDDMSKAWALVINEAAKRSGGFLLHSGGWHQVLVKHNQQAGGRLQGAMNAMMANVGWMGSSSGSGLDNPADQESRVDQLLGGSYGNAVRVGPW